MKLVKTNDVEVSDLNFLCRSLVGGVESLATSDSIIHDRS